MNEEQRAREWAEKIVAVQSGVFSATEAAKHLGVSRKTYYEKETAGLAAMVEAVIRKAGGRPATLVDPEKEQQRKQIRELKEEVVWLQQRLRIREVMDGTRLVGTRPGGKKKGGRVADPGRRDETAQRDNGKRLPDVMRDRGAPLRQPDALDQPAQAGGTGRATAGTAKSGAVRPGETEGGHPGAEARAETNGG